MTRRHPEEHDIQAIVGTGFDGLKGASYLLLRVVDARAARSWLRGVTPTALAEIGKAKKQIETAVQVALTAAGMRALEVDGNIVDRFAPEFIEGLARDENRSRRLGDTGDNAPARWGWGIDDREPHILIMLFTSMTCDACELAKRYRAEAEASGLATVELLQTSDMCGYEPFGFKDGISQPSLDWGRVRTPGTKADRAFTNLIALGEVLLGHRNEYGYPAESPSISAREKNATLLPTCSDMPECRDLGRNGSYLVYRQLAQNVRGFWQWIAKEASRLDMKNESLAELVVGRRTDGRPLPHLETGRAIPGVSDRERNGFTFDVDPDGLGCPIGAHIRRANPRTGDDPPGEEGPLDHLLVMLGLTMRWQRQPTTRSSPRNTTVRPIVRSQYDAIASSRFHRILRRGREYGEKLDPAKAVDPASDDPQAGLHFFCLNANIARQFEFVQGAWIASAKFAGLSGEQDPLLGNRLPFPGPPLAETAQRTDGFTCPAAKPHLRFSADVRQFVVVRGGAYFFLPGLSALKWIASD
jgi:deferrochelatase/peroxidase EfeB